MLEYVIQNLENLGIRQLAIMNIEQQEEIQRLNDIIEELEKWLEDNIEYGDDDYYDMKAMGVESALKKLKELKEGK